MGVLDQQTIDDWDRQQRADYAHSQRMTIAKLPCCGAGIEVEGGVDQYVECPNAQCPKRMELGRPPRHHIAWGLNPKVQSERPPLQL